MTTITVDLGNRAYPIRIGSGLLAQVSEDIAKLVPATAAAILTHPHLSQRYATPLIDGLRSRGIRTELIFVPPGERYKNLATMGRIYEKMVGAGLDRKSVLITLGGGVLGDVGGFAAASYLRGIPFVQVPTTLLAQVDASVGGKTGIDLPSGKNLVGAFHQPRGVFIDTDTLSTLATRELRSGLAEVIKYGIIRDKGFYGYVGRSLPSLISRQPDAITKVIARSCEIKAEVVGADETEQGLRAILNYGHTVGHALESATAYKRYKHGEAIAIGMVSAALIGEEIGYTPSDVTASITQTLTSAGLPSQFPNDVGNEEILAAMLRDKKTIGGRVHFILCPEIGKVDTISDIPSTAVEAALNRQRTIRM
jgi:3-dehydroquinate synthase